MHPDPSDAEIIERVELILARPEYASVTGAKLTAADRLFRELLESLLELVVRFPVLRWLLVVVLAILAAGFLALFAGMVSRGLRGSDPRRGVASTGGGGAEYARLARHLAQEGQYLAGAHCLLLATLKATVSARLIRIQPRDTNRQICALLTESSLDPAIREELVTLIRETEAAWFGTRIEDADLFERWCVTHGRLKLLLGGGQ